VLLTVVSVYLAGCATRPVAPVSQFEDLAGAITVPYQISDSGRLLVDVSINGGPARPMSVETGATVSVIYGDFAAQSNLTVSDRTRFVRGLVFAVTALDGDRIPVLIDTGSNLNFINWKLATLDESIRRLERRLIRNGTLQGALDSTSATLETTFYDLKLGGQYWDEVPVIVTGLGGLADIAPTDKPFMVAGANLFAPHTLALDLAGLMLYLHPETGL